jgi:hypothetical protein
MPTLQERMQLARKSSLQKKLDPRPHCEDCGRVLVQSDFDAYHDGNPSLGTPRCCEDCAELPG